MLNLDPHTLNVLSTVMVGVAILGIAVGLALAVSALVGEMQGERAAAGKGRMR